jgi:putative DNA primase/helicase
VTKSNKSNTKLTRNRAPDETRFRFWTDADIASLPDLKFLIESILPEGCFAVAHAPPATYKSFWAMDLMCHVATGLPWQGRQVSQGPVVYVAGEGKAGIKKRLAAWKKAKGVDGSIEDVFFVFEPVDLLNENAVDDFISKLASLKTPPKLIVLDTLARCFGGGDENSPSAMGQAVLSIQRIQQAYGSAVLVIHTPGSPTRWNVATDR